MIFRDRVDAGQQLARALATLGLAHPVVLGIPRGGVPVAAEVARALGAALGVVVARKIGAPGRPELAIGATTATGETFIDRRLAELTGADRDYIARTRDAQIAEARRREQVFDGGRSPPLAGRDVVIVDDGLATGATAFAAIRSVRGAGARSVVLAVPVGSSQTIERIRPQVDRIVCLDADPEFEAVGYYYQDFAQVTDEEVKATLDGFALGAPTRGG